MKPSMRFRRGREYTYEDFDSDTRTNLLGHTTSSRSSMYSGDFDYAMNDGFAFSKGDYIHGNSSYKRHRPLLKRIVVGSALTMGMMFFVFGSSSKSVPSNNLYQKSLQSAGVEMESQPQQAGYTKTTSSKTIKSHDKPPPIDMDEDHPHPVIQPRRFQKQVVAKPIPPMGNIDEKPKDVSGFLIYGQSDTSSSTSSSTSKNKKKSTSKTPPLPPAPPLKSTKTKTKTNISEEPPSPPPLESTKKAFDEPLLASDGDAEVISVLYYNPKDFTDTSKVPSNLYDSNGYAVSIEDLQGLELTVEHPELQLDESTEEDDQEDEESVSDSETSGSSRFEKFSIKRKVNINPSEWESIPQAQDQMIIVSTVATMAILVGALSARRLRSRHLLSSCIENESLEDELAYDTAYTTSGGGGYDTFTTTGSSGGLPWRGDLEKFDV